MTAKAPTRLSEALKTYRVPEDLTVHECNTCGDTGMIYKRDGTLIACPSDCKMAKDYKKALIGGLRKRSEMPERYKRYNQFDMWYSLDDQLISGKSTAILAAEAFTTRLADGFSLAELDPKRFADKTTSRSWVVIRGVNGMGKTALASTVANVLMEQHNTPVQFVTPRGLWFRINATFNRNEGETQTSIIQELATVPVLILDEFNIMASDYMRTIMEEIIRSRYNRAKPLPTLFTANANRDELNEIWLRQTMSAIWELSHLIVMGGKPLRDEGGSEEVS